VIKVQILIMFTVVVMAIVGSALNSIGKLLFVMVLCVIELRLQSIL